jgi:UrcA family protein
MNMRRFDMLRAITAITFAAAMVVSNASHADTLAPVAKQVVVNYSDLDLSRPAGASALITRMRAAAAQACGPAPDIRDLVMSQFYRQCVAEAVDRSVASVNSPMVTEVYSGRSTRVAAAGE